MRRVGTVRDSFHCERPVPIKPRLCPAVSGLFGRSRDLRNAVEVHTADLTPEQPQLDPSTSEMSSLAVS